MLQDVKRVRHILQQSIQGELSMTNTITLPTFPIKGTPVNTLEKVGIDTPSVRVQRRIYTSNATRYLKEIGEFDWGLFGAVTVAEYPNKHREIVDGGHRIWMVKEHLPGVEEVPAVVIPVADEQEAARLFYRFNGGAKKNVNGEEQFVAQVFGEEPAALLIEAGLKQAGLRVVSNNQTVGKKNGHVTKIGKFKDLYKKDPITSIRAAQYIIDAFPHDNTMNTMLFMGVYELIRVFNRLGVDFNKYEQTFVDWFGGVNRDNSQSDLTFPELRKDNHYGISIAYGLYQKWYRYMGNNDIHRPFAKKEIEDLYKAAGQRD